MKTERYSLTCSEYQKWLDYSQDESHEFIHVWSHIKTWLNVDICLDDDGYYVMNEHPLWLYFKNGYDEATAEWVPLIISEEECYIPLRDVSLNIVASDFQDVCKFGSKYYILIKQLADGGTNYTDFCTIVSQKILESKREISCELNDYIRIICSQRMMFYENICKICCLESTSKNVDSWKNEIRASIEILFWPVLKNGIPKLMPLNDYLIEPVLNPISYVPEEDDLFIRAMNAILYDAEKNVTLQPQAKYIKDNILPNIKTYRLANSIRIAIFMKCIVAGLWANNFDMIDQALDEFVAAKYILNRY